jgi:hypothetical protein
MTNMVDADDGRERHVITGLKYANLEEKRLLCLRPSINVDENVYFVSV